MLKLTLEHLGGCFCIELIKPSSFSFLLYLQDTYPACYLKSVLPDPEWMEQWLRLTSTNKLTDSASPPAAETIA